MPELVRQKIWDPVTRCWHWVLVLSVGIGWAFGRYMTFDTISWHFYLGYLTLALIVFRCFWGIIGPEPIRLTKLLPTPAALWHYLKRIGKRQPSGTRGHNPIGSISVLLMLLSIAGQAITGLFIVSDDFFESGPLAGYVSEAVSNRLTWWHHLNADILLVLVSLHVGAILFYLVWKRENLAIAMITGWKQVRQREEDPD